MQEAVIDTTANLAAMIDRAKILAGPDYFSCEKTHGRIKKSECVTRQEVGICPPGYLRREIPFECQDCAQGREIKQEAIEHMELKICNDTECKDYTPGAPNNCTYKGRYTKGMCKRKYMQKYYKDQEKGKGSRGKSTQVSRKETPAGPQMEIDAKEVRHIQADLEKPAEDAVKGPTLVVYFEGDEQLYEDLKKLAADQLRKVRNQALWYIKKGVRDDSAG